MFYHIDNGFGETRISHLRGSHHKLAGEKAILLGAKGSTRIGK
jgi:hypothetical protein